MGNSSSKAPKQAPPAPNNFKDEDMVEIGEGVKTGQFLLQKSLLQARERELNRAANDMNQYVNDIAKDIQGKAVEKINANQNEAQTVIVEKEATIEGLQSQIEAQKQEFQSAIECQQNTNATQAQEFSEKLNNMEQVLNDRGQKSRETYEKYYEQSSQVFPVKKYSPVCAEAVLAVGSCYAESKGQSLNCSTLVDELKKCVREARVEKGISS